MKARPSLSESGTPVGRVGSTESLPNELPALNGIRTICTLWIVIFHCLWTLTSFFPREEMVPFNQQNILYFIRQGLVCVDIFFVLTGFLLGKAVFADSRPVSFASSSFQPLRSHDSFAQISWRSFVWRRLVRIYPLYIALLFIYCVIMFPFGQYPLEMMGHEGVPTMVKMANPDATMMPSNCELTWANLLGMNNLIPFGGCAGWTWSLAIQIQFYLLFPAMVKLLGRGKRLTVALLVMIALSIPLRSWAFWKLYYNDGHLVLSYLYEASDIIPFVLRFYYYSLTPMRLPTIFMGVLVAQIFAQRQQWVSWLRSHTMIANTLFIASLAIFFRNLSTNPTSNLWWSVAFIQVGGTLFSAAIAYILLFILARLGTVGEWLNHQLSRPIFDYFAARSYTVYLFHMGFISKFYTTFLWPLQLSLPMLFFVYFPSVLIASTALAHVLDHYVDAPICRRLLSSPSIYRKKVDGKSE